MKDDFEEQNSEELETEDKQPATASDPTEMNFRYVCPACTGVAYYSSGAESGHVSSICHNCGADLPSFDQNNLIALTEDEKESLRQLRN